MSKRGSRNAKRFGGKIFSVGYKKPGKQKRVTKKQASRTRNRKKGRIGTTEKALEEKNKRLATRAGVIKAAISA